MLEIVAAALGGVLGFLAGRWLLPKPPQPKPPVCPWAASLAAKTHSRGPHVNVQDESVGVKATDQEES